MRSMLYRSFLLFATAMALTVAVADQTIVYGQENLAVPAPSAQIADRMGVYAWGFESSAYQSQTGGQIDRLNWAADKVAQIGSRTIRLNIPGAVYGLPN